MTSSLSKSINRTLNWARIDRYPVEIVWDMLPKRDEPRVPLLPWMFGYSPNYFKTQLHWWDYPNKSTSKPAWWDHPERLVGQTSAYSWSDANQRNSSTGCMRFEFRDTYSANRYQLFVIRRSFSADPNAFLHKLLARKSFVTLRKIASVCSMMMRRRRKGRRNLTKLRYIDL